MAPYQAPLRDMQFVLRELAGLDRIVALPGYEESGDVVDAILEEAATFAREVLDPLNQSGTKKGARGATVRSQRRAALRKRMRGLLKPAGSGFPWQPNMAVKPYRNSYSGRRWRCGTPPMSDSRMGRCSTKERSKR